MANTSNFKYFNPNPTGQKVYKTGKKAGTHPRWQKGDCTVRALAGAINCSWITALELLYEKAKIFYDIPNSVEMCGEVLKDKGFTKCSIKVGKGQHRPTVAELAKELKDSYCVFRVAGHMVCAHDGNYYDAWDCGDCAVYQYWKK